MNGRHLALCAIFLSLAASSWADIDYKVSIRPESRMAISLDIPVRSAVTQLQMPNWGPGSYVLRDNWKNVQDVSVTDESGKSIQPTKPNDYTWTIPSSGLKRIKVSYTTPITISDEIAHYSGPANYMYVVGRIEEKCTLQLDLPADWKHQSGMNMQGNRYVAPTYDVFADNPVTVGKFRQLEYKVLGKPHYIVLYGAAREDLDTSFLLKACSFISQSQNDFFGNRPPYDKYVWHFNVGRRADGGGGLEHLSSTQITLANGLGPGIIGVNAHEFFHLWNVKRIRSKPLGPFDYTQLPQTGALWWLEGGTDYFAHQFMSRYGWWDDKKFYSQLLSNMRGVRSRQARMEVSPYEASFRVREAANNRGNSDGYKVSYYNTGFIALFCLDVEMLALTNGRRSLDDVERALWDITKDDQPGFAEDEIRKQMVRFGGEAAGAYYDQIVMKPGEIPVEAQLAKLGLTVKDVEREQIDLGITVTRSRERGGWLVGATARGAEGKLQRDDVILAINGADVSTTTGYQAVVDKLQVGSTAKMTIKRGDSTMDVDVPVASIKRTVSEVVEMSNADAGQRRLREIFMYRGKKGWKPRP